MKTRTTSSREGYARSKFGAAATHRSDFGLLVLVEVAANVQRDASNGDDKDTLQEMNAVLKGHGSEKREGDGEKRVGGEAEVGFVVWCS